MKLFLASMLANVLSLLGIVAVTWIYEPQEFGYYAGLMSWLSIAIPVVHLRLHFGFAAAREDQVREMLLSAALLTSVALSLLVAVPIAASIMISDLGFVARWLLVALASLLLSVLEISSYWSAQHTGYGRRELALVARPVLTFIFQWLLVDEGTLGIFMGMIFGTAASIGMNTNLRNPLSSASKLVLMSFRYWDTISKNIHLPMFGVPQGFLASLSWNIVPLLVLQFYGPHTAGVFWVAFRVVLAVLSSVNSAYRLSYISTFGRLNHSESNSLSLRHGLVLLAFGLFIVVAIHTVGKFVLPVVFGLGFGLTSEVLEIFGFIVCAELFKIPALTRRQSQGHQKLVLQYEVFVFILKISATTLMLMLHAEFETLLWVYVFSSTAGWLSVWIWDRFRIAQ